MNTNKNINILRQYAKLRKLPGVIKLGILDDNIKSQLIELSVYTQISNHRAAKNRQGIYGVEHDATSPLGKTYNQKHIDNFMIGIDNLNSFKNKTDWRFAELQPSAVIPMHLDDPKTYRFLVMLSGEQIFYTECKKIKQVQMYPGDIYFVNPAYKHSVENKNEKRIALLGKMEINEYNTELLRART